jgi:hypothetical protein
VRSKDYSAVLLNLGEGQMHNITKLRHKSRKKWEKNKENLKNTKKLRITA